jgi:hypothetical protein
MSRSVVNHQEFTDRLASISRHRPKHIQDYVKTTVRKFFLKNWEKASEAKKSEKTPKFLGFKTKTRL